MNIEKCDELGIKIVRRTSAGGSIYTDKDQLIFGLITPHALGSDVEDTFKKVCGGIINALAELDIPSKFKEPNDITINEKKISGSAQVKKKYAYIIHSTVILALDDDIVDQLLKNAKPGYTSSIQHEMGFKPDIDLVKTAIKTAFHKTFGVSFKNGQFSRSEKILIDDLIKNKYSSKAWNFKR